MRFDFFGFVMIALFTLITLFIGVAFYDGAMQFKAEPKTIACRAQQMEPMRYSFTDSVVCVPHPTRRDTLAIQEVK
jgi:hypothetical protein